MSTEATLMPGGSGRGSKVGRVAHRYDLDGISQDLADRWTDDEDRYSVRDLGRYFNERVLESAMTAAGMDLLDGEVENIYRLLTDEDVSSGKRTKTERRLEREGLDVEKLRSDFVSHQTIYRYLNEHLQVEHEREDDEERTEKYLQRIRALKNRTEVITEDTLERLKNVMELEIDEFHVLVDVSVLCSKCGRHHTLEELVENKGCCKATAERES